MGGICYRKNFERGLHFEIKCLQDLLDSPTAREQDKVLAKKLIKVYRGYSEKDYTERTPVALDTREKSKSGASKG